MAKFHRVYAELMGWEYKPRQTTSPWETILDLLEERNMSLVDLDIPITEELAELLEKKFKTHREYWLRHEQMYREQKEAVK